MILLGKLIEYAAGLDAKAAIWLSKDVRDEHKKSIISDTFLIKRICSLENQIFHQGLVRSQVQMNGQSS